MKLLFELKKIFMASRFPFSTASVLSAILAVCWSWQYGKNFDFTKGCLAILGVLLVHLTANTLNDYFDWDGTDKINKFATPFSGGSRQSIKKLYPETDKTYFAKISLLFITLASLVALSLIVLERPWVLFFGFIGFILGLAYSSPPFSLMTRGLGELIIFISFGPLITAGTGYCTEGVIRLEHLLIGLPIGFLVTNILWVNQFPDYESDQKTGKLNLVVRLGKKKARWGYFLILLLSFVTTIILSILKIYPLWAPAVFLLLIPMGKQLQIIIKQYDSNTNIVIAQAATIKGHAGITLALAIICALL